MKRIETDWNGLKRIETYSNRLKQLVMVSIPMVRVRGATGANRAAASGRLRADRPGAFPDQYLKQCDNFMIQFISINIQCKIHLVSKVCEVEGCEDSQEHILQECSTLENKTKEKSDKLNYQKLYENDCELLIEIARKFNTRMKIRETLINK